MKIKNISVSNFLAFTSASVDLGRLNIITGGNNAGKSSLFRDALLFAFTGLARDLKRKNQSKDLVKDGAKSGGVNIVTEINGEEMTFKRTGSGAATAKNPFGCSDAALRCVTDVMAFIRMTPDERLAILSEIGTSDFQAVTAILEKALPHELAETLAAKAIEKRKAAEDYCVARRRELNGEAKALQETPAPNPDECLNVNGASVQLSTVREADIKKRLDEGRRRLSDLEHTAGSVKLIQNADTIEEQIAAKNQEIIKHTEALKKEQNKLKYQLTTGEKMEGLLKQAEKDAEAIKGKISAEQGRLEGYLETQKQLQAAIDGLNAAGTTCPFGEAFGFACAGLAGEMKNVAVESLKAKQQQAAEKWQKISDNITALTIELGKKNHEADEYFEAVCLDKKAAERIREIESLLRGAAGSELQKLMTERDTLIKSKELIGKATGVDAQIDSLQTEIADLEALHRRAIEYDKISGDYKINIARAKAKQQEAEKWDAAQKLLSAEGEIAQLCSSGWDVNHLNRMAMVMFGVGSARPVEIQADGIVRLDGRLVELCSESEKYRVGCLCSDVIARGLKTGFIVFDGVEILKGDASARMQEFVGCVTDDNETVIVINSGDNGNDIVINRIIEGTTETVKAFRGYGN